MGGVCRRPVVVIAVAKKTGALVTCVRLMISSSCREFGGSAMVILLGCLLSRAFPPFPESNVSQVKDARLEALEADNYTEEQASCDFL